MMKCYILGIILLAQLYVVRSDRSLDDYLRQTVNNIKVMMPTGDPSIGIPPLDPYRMNDISTNTRNRRVKISLKLQNLVLTGASKFNVEKLHVNLGNLSLKVDVLFEELKMTGKYNLKGTLMNFFPIYGNGSTLVIIKGFRINSTLSLDVDWSNGRMKISSFVLNLDYAEANISLQNILGGGNLGRMVNMLIQNLARPMFRKHKSKLESMAKEAISKIFDKRLKNVDIRKFMDKLNVRSVRSIRSVKSVNLPDLNSVNTYIDNLLNNAKSDPSLQIDPLIIPDKNTRNRGVRIQIKDGRVYGLRSVHRVGNMVLNCDQNTFKCIFTGEIGFNNIRAGFKTRLRWRFIRMSPSIDCTVKEIRVKFEINLNLQGRKGEAATLQSFKISKFTTPIINIRRIGILGRVLSFLTKLLGSWVQKTTRNAIERPLRNAIVKSLSRVSFPS